MGLYLFRRFGCENRKLKKGDCYGTTLKKVERSEEDDRDSVSEGPERDLVQNSLR
ncbi:MAG: hypothetical protein DIU64_006995 [Caldicoprobacter oshimai]|uniref:Uncharacterized protein n=1 Tax=Caldicoprobacter faecalis TaxID=937334 RepID=A0A1I5VRZ0_9FIRM|nr:hypothetical protein [Caldicoprobacter faecalis]SFQ10220.1 hypothetical protein SAMN05444406_11243 [Caldicoprobacter faecalis]